MKQIIFVLSSCLFLAACVNWDVTGPAGPEGPPGPPAQKPPGADTSSIVGRVFTFDQFTTPIWPVDSVIITLYLRADSSIETTADTAGYYRFTGISTGTYNLTFNRNRFGEMKVFGQTHISGGTLNTTVQDVSIVEIPTVSVPDSAWYENVSPEYFTLRFREPFVGNGMSYRNHQIFISRHADVSATNYLIQMEYGGPWVTKGFLTRYFSPGDSIYTRVYTLPKYFYQPIVGWSNTVRPGISYTDPATGEVIFPFRSEGSALAAGVFN